MNRATDVDVDELDIGLPTASAIANVYFQAAESLGFETHILSRQHAVGAIRRGERELMICDRWVGINDLTATTLCGNRFYSALALREAGAPVPDFVLAAIADQNDATVAARRLADAARDRYPVCIKPVQGSHGRCVVPDIRAEKELLGVIFRDRTIGRVDTLVQAHLAGRRYRVVVAFGEVIGCVERTAPVVIGDGIGTLTELVTSFNEARGRYSLAPAQMGPRQLFTIARRDGFGLCDVIEAGRAVLLDDRCDLEVGGAIHHVDVDDMAPVARQICVKAAGLFDLEFAGLDIIGDDLSRDDGSWYVDEVDSQPVASVPVPTMTRAERLQWPRRLLERYFVG